MGRRQRPRPIRLAAKLLQVRHSLGLSQQQMLERLDYQQSPLFIGHISQFEQDKREPPMPLLLRYARVAGVCLEELVDDEVDLPKTMERALKGNLGKVIRAIRDFDNYESLFHHDQLEVSIPSGFYRYSKTTDDPDEEWDSVDVSLIYRHRELKFSIRLTERSRTPSFTIVKHRVRRRECVTEYRVAEEVNLSIRDAKQLLIFLQGYFRCFYFNINTKLSK
jgi:transcriptional regulator with XRE-family HTH domain